MHGLDDFGGIFRLNQLRNLKILSYPVSLIILANEHWISLYITEKTVEIMDSAGFINNKNMHKTLRRFLRAQINQKKLTVTPKLQGDGSNACGLYATSFIYYRTVTNKSLCDFSKIFTSDTSVNCAIIQEIFETIWKIWEWYETTKNFGGTRSRDNFNATRLLATTKRTFEAKKENYTRNLDTGLLEVGFRSKLDLDWKLKF